MEEDGFAQVGLGRAPEAGGEPGNGGRAPVSLGWWSHSGKQLRKEKQIAAMELWVLNVDHRAGLESTGKRQPL